MALPKEQLTCSIEQYLAMERASNERHEYVDGYIYLMAGESLEHSSINANLLAILVAQLRGKPCRALSPNMKIRSGPYIKEQKSNKGMFSYADVSVVCGEPQFHDDFQDVLLNPTLLIEILSQSTRGYDSVEKFHRYRTNLPSLQQYVLVRPDLPLIEVYSRHTEGWLMTEARTLEDSIPLSSINCSLPLAEVYDRIVFPPSENQEESAEGE